MANWHGEMDETINLIIPKIDKQYLKKNYVDWNRVFPHDQLVGVASARSVEQVSATTELKDSAGQSRKQSFP